MAYFKSRNKYINPPIPDIPPYVPPSPPTPPTPESGSDTNVPKPSFTGSVGITYYINNSDFNVMHKSLNTVGSDTIVFKDSTSIVNPTVRIESSTDLTSVNYVKIGSYYYYAHVVYMTNNIYQIDCNMDGLMSADYSSCTGSLVKSASNFNNYLNGNLPVVSYEQVKTLKFPNGFSKNPNYLLVAIGSNTGGGNNG